MCFCSVWDLRFDKMAMQPGTVTREGIKLMEDVKKKDPILYLSNRPFSLRE